MARGCIIGDCYICGFPVFEDEAVWNNNLRHSQCKTIRRLRQENEALRRELEEYRRWFEGKAKLIPIDEAD